MLFYTPYNFLVRKKKPKPFTLPLLFYFFPPTYLARCYMTVLVFTEIYFMYIFLKSVFHL